MKQVKSLQRQHVDSKRVFDAMEALGPLMDECQSSKMEKLVTSAKGKYVVTIERHA